MRIFQSIEQYAFANGTKVINPNQEMGRLDIFLDMNAAVASGGTALTMTEAKKLALIDNVRIQTEDGVVHDMKGEDFFANAIRLTGNRPEGGGDEATIAADANADFNVYLPIHVEGHVKSVSIRLSSSGISGTGQSVSGTVYVVAVDRKRAPCQESELLIQALASGDNIWLKSDVRKPVKSLIVTATSTLTLSNVAIKFDNVINALDSVVPYYDACQEWEDDVENRPANQFYINFPEPIDTKTIKFQLKTDGTGTARIILNY